MEKEIKEQLEVSDFIPKKELVYTIQSQGGKSWLAIVREHINDGRIEYVTWHNSGFSSAATLEDAMAILIRFRDRYGAFGVRYKEVNYEK